MARDFAEQALAAGTEPRQPLVLWQRTGCSVNSIVSRTRSFRRPEARFVTALAL
ncbi:MAG: hypothetical protein R2855_10030 [Thermomicrobiales bacterium]